MLKCINKCTYIQTYMSPRTQSHDMSHDVHVFQEWSKLIIIIIIIRYTIVVFFEA